MSSIAPSLSVAKCHYPVTGLGFGERVGIWLQGCSIRCPGCIVPDTWEPARELVPLHQLLEQLLPWLDNCDGVTISGGEPFDQASGLHALLVALRALGVAEILVYSGYTWRRLQAGHAPLLALCDVVVSEPFALQRAERSNLAGSSNQRVHLLTPLSQERYQDWQHFSRAVSIAEESGAVFLAGILSTADVLGLAQRLHGRPTFLEPK